MTPSRPVTLAVLIGAHGVGGEVRLKIFAESADSLKAHKSFNGGTLTLKSLRDGSNGTIARFAEIPDRTTAERLRGTEITVPRDTLPPLGEGEYYHADLIGLTCASTEGTDLGRVVAVEDFGAGDILEIETAGGLKFMVPVRVCEIGESSIAVDAAFCP